MQFGVYPIYFGPIRINLTIVFLASFVLALAIVQKTRGKRIHFLEISLLLFLVVFLYLTLHGRLLQVIFPIVLPERPLVDNNLTFNYTLTSILTFTVFPIIALILLKSNISLEKLGLRVHDISKLEPTAKMRKS
jgi:cytochrome bd-type quinol oxidase subunit 2